MSDKVFGTERKGSIKDIPLPENKSGNNLDLSKPGESGQPPVSSGRGVNNWDKSRSRNRRAGTKWIGIGLGVLLLLVAYSFLFHRSTVEIDQQSQNVVVTNKEYSAALQGGEDTLEFVSIEPFVKTERIFVEGSIEENRQTTASGVITVFNTDDSEKNYIKNTRFQTPEGNVYRAFNRFTIPAGSEENPGSTEVLVVAENPGTEYNSEEGLTFKLPALREQGSPSYDLVYAEQTEPLTGGYSGVVRVPLEEDIQEAEDELRESLEEGLAAEFRETLSDEYVIRNEFIELADPVFTQEPDEERGGVEVVARGELYAVVFRKDEFERFLARDLISEYQGEDIDIANISELTINVSDEDFSPEDGSEFSFMVVGEAQFLWPVDETQVKELLAGKLRSHVENDLVVGLDHVTVSDVSVSPFWRRSLPSNTDRITININ